MNRFLDCSAVPVPVPVAANPCINGTGAGGGAGAGAGAGAGTGAGFGTGTSLPKKTNRCHDCRKKLGLLPFHCRCGNDFCSEHIGSSAHSCKFNYNGEQIKQLSERLDMKGLSIKLESI